MPKTSYERVSDRVRRATMSETDAERAKREKLSKARSRLAQADALPEDAPAWAVMLWERLRAIETLMRKRQGGFA